ncbi:MAG: hypothetical protein ACI9FJ_000800 [Alteromonadaceae bacterium]|jgi:hypothetical protein
MSSQDELDEIVAFAEEQVKKLAEKAKLEKDLARQMPHKFEENIRAFGKYLPKVAEQFRHYRPKEMQLFCAKSGAANLIDSVSGTPLYGDDPVGQCRDQVDRLIASPQFTSLAFSLSEDVQNTFIHTKYLNEMYQVYLQAKKEFEPLSTVPEHLGSAIVFGVGLGYHLTHLLNDITIDHLYICEPDQDWFFASLYTCDWKEILETVDERDGYIFFHLGVSYEQFITDFINELKDKGSFNAVNALLYQHYPSEKLTQIIQQFNHDFHMVSMGWGFFDDGIISIAHDFANAKNNAPILKRNAKLPNKWRGVPAFILANGPSLDQAIETIKEYQGQAIVFCCGSALPTLLKEGIIPDFHLALERTKFTYDYYNEFIDHDVMKQINLLTVNIMHPDCLKLFKWSGIGYKAAEPSTIIACDFMDQNQNYVQLRFCNPQVGNTALSFASFMGFEEIYLFGVDAGYKDPLQHHSKSSMYYTKSGKEKEALGTLLRAGEIVVDGNFGGTVFSPAFFNCGRLHLEYLLDSFPKVNCYNCSDGAKIKNAAPLRPDDLLIMKSLIDKQEMIEYIKENLYLTREFSEQAYIDYIAIDKFMAICDKLISYVDREFTSRAEIATALMHQIRYLFSYAYTRYRHIYFMLEGSLTYVQSVFRMILYGFADEQITVQKMHEVMKIFIVYMQEAKKKYQRVLEEVDEQECYLMSMLLEGEDEE